MTAFRSPWDLELVAQALRGVSRFDDFRRELGISRQVLAVRLRALVAEGVLVREQYQRHPERYDYRLTPKGVALGPVVAEMSRWSERWGVDAESSGRDGRSVLGTIQAGQVVFGGKP